MNEHKNKKDDKTFTIIIIVLVFLIIIGICLVLALIFLGNQNTLNQNPTNQTHVIEETETTSQQITAEPVLETTAEAVEIKSKLYTISNKKSIMTKTELFEKNNLSVVSIETSDGGGGSGVILTEDNYIITNEHVISGFSECKVLFKNQKSMENEKEYDARVLFYDEYKDLALLKLVTDDKNSFANICLTENVKVGEDVCAIGNPRSLINTLTVGTVSAFRNNDGVELIQTDATISFGSSGGALFNMSGELIGVTTSSYDDKNFSFAVSGDEIIRFLDEAIKEIDNSNLELAITTKKTEINNKPIVIGVNGMLLGAFDGKEIYDGREAYSYFNDKDYFNTYINESFVGSEETKMFYYEQVGEYTLDSVTLSKYTDSLSKSDFILSVSNSSPKFQSPTLIDNQNETYNLIAKDFIADVYPNTKIDVEKIFQFDLEMDGVNEILILAKGTNKEGISIPILLFRKVTNGVVSTSYINRSYEDDENFVYNWESKILSLCDLDGDGYYEIILRDEFLEHEIPSYRVYVYNNHINSYEIKMYT